MLRCFSRASLFFLAIVSFGLGVGVSRSQAQQQAANNSHRQYLLVSEYIGVRDQEARDVLAVLDTVATNATPSAEVTENLDFFRTKYQEGFGLAFLFEEPNYSRATVSYIFPCQEPSEAGRVCITLQRFSKGHPCPQIETLDPPHRLSECYRNDEYYGESGVAGALAEANLSDALARLRGYLYEVAAGCGSCRTMENAIQQNHLTVYNDRILGGPDMNYHTLRAQGVQINLNEPSYWSRTGQVDPRSLKVFDAARALQENHLIFLGHNAHCSEFRGPHIMSESDFRYVSGQCGYYMMGGDFVGELFETMEQNGFQYIDGRWTRECSSMPAPH